jgi:hypothetical protein
MRIVVLLALSVPLAGCFSLTAEKPIPEWAMQPHAVVAEPGAVPQRSAAVRRHHAPKTVAARPRIDLTASIDTMPTNVQPAGLNHAVVRRRPTALGTGNPTDMTAFSPEWHAREDARDADLKRSMNNICRGC